MLMSALKTGGAHMKTKMKVLLMSLCAVFIMLTGSGVTVHAEELSFGNAYDVQRGSFPQTGAVIECWGRTYPYLSNFQQSTTSTGNWTLTELGSYGVVSKSIQQSTELIVMGVIAAYTDLQKNDVCIHELKDGETHVAYGVIVASDGNGKVVFVGDSLRGGAGYLLSTGEITDTSISVTGTKIAPDYAATARKKVLSLTGISNDFFEVNEEHSYGEFKISEEGYDALTAELTVQNVSKDATGELKVSLQGMDADYFELSKTSIASIAAGAEDTFTVKTKEGLTQGTYMAAIFVEDAAGSIQERFDVYFTVTAVEKPSATPAPAEPSATPAPAEPSATPAPAEPSATPAPAEPSATPAPAEPSATPAPAEPSATPAPAEPSATPAPAEPSATPAPAEPSATPAPAEPSATPAPAEPSATPAPAEPSATPAPAEPSATPAPAEPSATPAPAEPSATPAPAEPSATPAPAEPSATPAPAEPSATPAPAEPSATPAPAEPSATPAPAQPTATPAPANNDSSDDDDDDEAVQETVAATPAPEVLYTVQKGDTLIKIARLNGCSLRELMEANVELLQYRSLIYPNWVLKIPNNNALAVQNTQAPGTTKLYKVQKGDSLWKIARNNKCTVKEIITLNPITVQKADLIYPGWELLLPEK